MEKTHGRHKARYLYHPLVSQQQELLPRCRTQNKTPANAPPYGPQSRMATLTRTTAILAVSVPRASCPCVFTRAKHPRSTGILPVFLPLSLHPPTSLRGPSGPWQSDASHPERHPPPSVTPSEAQRSRGVYWKLSLQVRRTRPTRQSYISNLKSGIWNSLIHPPLRLAPSPVGGVSSFRGPAPSHQSDLSNSSNLSDLSDPFPYHLKLSLPS